MVDMVGILGTNAGRRMALTEPAAATHRGSPCG